MPSLRAKTPQDIGAFADFLRQLIEEGFEFTVIGGMAGSSYAGPFPSLSPIVLSSSPGHPWIIAS